jgi:hypothetical protein
MYTMEQEFYRGRLEDRHGIEILVPDRTERGIVHEIIYSELVVGRIVEASRLAYQRVMASLVDHGAQGIILGCTEIGLPRLREGRRGTDFRHHTDSRGACCRASSSLIEWLSKAQVSSRALGPETKSLLNI